MKVIEILMYEHSLIFRALEILSQAQIKIEKDQRPPRAFFETALVFLREFADQFHHFKEEYLTFGLLALKKGDAFDGPIGGLRFQHERCRACVDGISDSLDGYADGDDIATTTLLENLASYISLLRRHIYEEDHTFADKRPSCLSCRFFSKVRAEEGTANLRTKFLRFISEDADGPVLKNMRYMQIQAGKRFITQGEAADAASIIQRGT